jgi:hypothetical protein
MIFGKPSLESKSGLDEEGPVDADTDEEGDGAKVGQCLRGDKDVEEVVDHSRGQVGCCQRIEISVWKLGLRNVNGTRERMMSPRGKRNIDGKERRATPDPDYSRPFRQGPQLQRRAGSRTRFAGRPRLGCTSHRWATALPFSESLPSIHEETCS